MRIEDMCDGCGDEMVTVDKVTGWMTTVGKDPETGLPLVKMYCRACHDDGRIPERVPWEQNPGRFLAAGLVHQTATARFPEGFYGVLCRCDWEWRGYSEHQGARRAGDEHLKEANS